MGFEIIATWTILVLIGATVLIAVLYAEGIGKKEKSPTTKEESHLTSRLSFISSFFDGGLTEKLESLARQADAMPSPAVKSNSPKVLAGPVGGKAPDSQPKRKGNYNKKWERLRYQVLAENKPECMLCGSNQKPLHVDHIKPKSKYPQLQFEKSNLQVLCERCNLAKSNVYEDDFRNRGA